MTFIGVTDHSKIDEPELAVYAPWRDVGALVTDAEPPRHLRDTLKCSGVSALIALQWSG
jgi:DeoR/GlpR family transcriptional regulator of sugar metabolism